MKGSDKEAGWSGKGEKIKTRLKRVTKGGEARLQEGSLGDRQDWKREKFKVRNR